MHRFFVSAEAIAGAEAIVTGETAHQISRVLRMRTGDDLVLFTPEGDEYLVTITAVGKEMVTTHIVQQGRGRNEPTHQVDLYLSLLNKADKFEWALQKCTELGVARVIPVVAARSVAGAPERGRRERWERITKEAAEQSGRTTLPTLDDATPLSNALRAAGSRSVAGPHAALIPAVGAGTSVREALGAPRVTNSISLFIGPEGGFTDEELALASESGVEAVSLGPRILRAETAAVAALTIVLYSLGEMG